MTKAKTMPPASRAATITMISTTSTTDRARRLRRGAGAGSAGGKASSSVRRGGPAGVGERRRPWDAVRLPCRPAAPPPPRAGRRSRRAALRGRRAGAPAWGCRLGFRVALRIAGLGIGDSGLGSGWSGAGAGSGSGSPASGSGVAGSARGGPAGARVWVRTRWPRLRCVVVRGDLLRFGFGLAGLGRGSAGLGVVRLRLGLAGLGLPFGFGLASLGPYGVNLRLGRDLGLRLDPFVVWASLRFLLRRAARARCRSGRRHPGQSASRGRRHAPGGGGGRRRRPWGRRERRAGRGWTLARPSPGLSRQRWRLRPAVRGRRRPAGPEGPWGPANRPRRQPCAGLCITTPPTTADRTPPIVVGSPRDFHDPPANGQGHLVRVIRPIPCAVEHQFDTIEG